MTWVALMWMSLNKTWIWVWPYRVLYLKISIYTFCYKSKILWSWFYIRISCKYMFNFEWVQEYKSKTIRTSIHGLWYKLTSAFAVKLQIKYFHTDSTLQRTVCSYKVMTFSIRSTFACNKMSPPFRINWSSDSYFTFHTKYLNSFHL